MMYVFHVDQGRMMTFDMNWMFEDIRKLKEVIERHHAIPARSIVLLVSGGELLVNDSRVCNYATGTDTNPIYMFSTNIKDLPPASTGPNNTEVDLAALVQKSLELPVSYQTVVARTQLAAKICEMAREEFKRCEALVHEQHLQQQGWAAVVANMEDTVKEFTERCENFFRYYEEHLRQREEQSDILQHFDKNLQELADIPILSTLMENAESRPYGVFDEVFHHSSATAGSSSVGSAGSKPPSVSQASESQQTSATKALATGETSQPNESTTDDTQKASAEAEESAGVATLTETERAKGISLLDWISASEGQLTLKRMAEECRIELDKFDRKLLTTFNDRIAKAVNMSQNNDIKVVKGLEERLCGLDQLLADAKKIVQDQNELAQSIQMNQTRANILGDASILPDLCTLHQNHLRLMLDNHKKMFDYRRRCTVAKDQLSDNITKRLAYIISVETKVSEHDNYMLFYRTSLKRLQKHLSIIEQIHMAPCMYVSAVTEVVRRRMFSSSFLRWASDLACRLMTIHNEEVMRRQEFTAQFEGHFLSSLFPGMSDLPPSYAIQAPSVFDSSLPALDKQDLEELSRFLPELTEQIPLPNIASVIDFFQTRSVEQQQNAQQQQNSTNSTNKDDTSGSGASKSNDSQDPARQSSEKVQVGAESETDTEEFEKVHDQSTERHDEATQVGGGDDEHAERSLPVATCSVSTSTETVEKVCAETLTEVRYNDTIPTTNTTLTATTASNAASSCSTNILTTTTTTKTMTSVKSATSETGTGPENGPVESGEQEFNANDGRRTVDRKVRKAGHPPPLGSCSTRTSSFSDRSSSQELLVVDNVTGAVGSTFASLLTTVGSSSSGRHPMKSPGDEGEFINSEFYIDESLPSSATSVERVYQRQLQQQHPQLQHPQLEVRQTVRDCLVSGRGSYDEGTIILLLQDNLGSTRLEVERLKGLLGSVHELTQQSISVLREQLTSVRTESDTNRAQFQAQLGAINRAWTDMQALARNRERETIQQLTVDHELEMNDLRKSIHQKDDEVQSLRADNSTMKASHIATVASYEQEKRQLSDQISEMRGVIGHLESQLAEAAVDRKRAIEEAVEQLEHRHRTDIETLRGRYKLMASVDKSPSDTSLEKIEKPDTIDLALHVQILGQAREEFDQTLKNKIKAAVEEERQRWESNAIAAGGSGAAGNRLHRSYTGSGGGSPGTTPTSGGSQDVYKRILEEKDRQLEEMREKEALLVRENRRMKETIQSLTDPELSLCETNCRNQLETVEAERQKLADELVCQRHTVYALRQERQSLAREIDNQRKDAAQLLSCSEGDTVTFVFNPPYTQYTIVQDSKFLFFVHESSYEELGLQPLVPGVIPMVSFGIGTVVYKEFCHARRDDNRYRVARGTQFYRIKLKPISLQRKSKGGRSSSSKSSSGSSGGVVVNAEDPRAPPATVTIQVNESSGTSGTRVTTASTTTPSSYAIRLIDSFAQTEVPPSMKIRSPGSPAGEGSKSPTGSSRDMIDSGVVDQQRSSYRERNVSITDEDDIPPVIGSDGSIDRIRYQSVCEEEDPDRLVDDGEELVAEESGGGGGSATVILSCYTSATDTSIVTIRTGLAASMGTDSMSASELSGGDCVADHPQNHHLLYATNNPPTIADDVSDSADSEYRSLEANDQDDSDSAAAPLPTTTTSTASSSEP